MATRKSIDSLHPSIAYIQAIVDNLPKTTGKSLDEWLRLVAKQKFGDAKACTIWLKEEHLLGGTTAGTIAVPRSVRPVGVRHFAPDGAVECSQGRRCTQRRPWFEQKTVDRPGGATEPPSPLPGRANLLYSSQGRS